MINKDKEQLKAICGESINAFANVFLKNYTKERTPDFHIEIEKAFRENQFIEVIAPRGHAKSTVVSFICALWSACYKKANYIIICSDSLDQAVRFLGMIKNEIETNELLQEVFGNMKDSKCWNEREIVLNGVKIDACGAKMNMRGKRYLNSRPDLIICDDIQNNELVANQRRRDKLEDWFNSVVIPALEPTGKLILIGTTIHYGDLMCRVKDKELYPKFKTLEFKAIQDNGEPLWKERFSLEKLEEIKQDFIKRGMKHIFDREYMNNPVSDDDRVFEIEKCKYYKLDDIKNKKLKVYLAMDRAYTKGEKSDSTGIALVGIDEEDNWYVLTAKGIKGNDTEIISEYFSQCNFGEQYGRIEYTGVEQKGFENTLKLYLDKEMQTRGKYYNIQELKDGGTPKEIRIQALQPIYNQGKIFIRKDQVDLLDQLFDFPRLEHDDIIDALAYILQLKQKEKHFMVFSV